MNSGDGQVSNLRFRPRKGQAMRLNRDKRYQIEALLEAGIPQKDIARMLGISPGGLSKEISRNGGAKRYDPEKAEKRATRLAKKSHVHLKFNDEVWTEIDSMILEDLSPEQIAGRGKLEGKAMPSVPSIYRHVKGNPGLGKHLRHNKKYRGRSPAKDGRGSIRNQRSVDDRPAIVDEKTRFGDFEIDLINGARHKGNVFTANDRMSGFCILEPLRTKDADDLAETMIAAFEPYKEYLHTVTSDNGKEFAGHLRMAEELKIDYFFAHPYRSWERGANENMNGLIRQYLPKGTSFENLTRAEVKRIEWKLNNRPRKRLGYLTPLEYISWQVKQIYLAT